MDPRVAARLGALSVIHQRLVQRVIRRRQPSLKSTPRHEAGERALRRARCTAGGKRVRGQPGRDAVATRAAGAPAVHRPPRCPIDHKVAQRLNRGAGERAGSGPSSQLNFGRAAQNGRRGQATRDRGHERCPRVVESVHEEPSTRGCGTKRRRRHTGQTAPMGRHGEREWAQCCRQLQSVVESGARAVGAEAGTSAYGVWLSRALGDRRLARTVPASVRDVAKL